MPVKQKIGLNSLKYVYGQIRVLDFTDVENFLAKILHNTALFLWFARNYLKFYRQFFRYQYIIFIVLEKPASIFFKNDAISAGAAGDKVIGYCSF